MAKSDAVVDQVQAVQAKTDKEIAGGYTGAVGSIDKAIEHLSGLKDALRQQGTQVGEAGEERRRAHDKAMYDLAKERQAARDAHDREDAEREEAFQKRERAVTDAETELLTLLKVNVPEGEPVPRPQVIREALAKVVADAERGAAARATAEAKREYETQKRIADAEAEKTNALLKQKNEQLEAQNAKLSAQNEALTRAAERTVTDMKEVAAGAFQAAGGVVNQGNAALSSAASASGRSVRA
jgi:DNA repair exonuclease SbcCD ATPase subunit